MTEIYSDVVEVDMQIDGYPWMLIDGEVSLSKNTTPNYVKIRQMTPDPSETLGNIPDPIDDLIGTPFELNVDTSLISERDTDANEDTLLFDGFISNISPTGENTYEAQVFDPGQQAFRKDEEGVAGEASILNQKIYIPPPSSLDFNPVAGNPTEMRPRVIQASELVQNIVDKAGITNYEINLALGGVTVSGRNGEYTGGYDRLVYFQKARPTIEKALTELTLQTESSWLFDKEGTFYFGVPEPVRHELQFITQTSAGMTTPPYQSVRVIGSGLASEEGWSKNTLNPENQLVAEARIVQKPDKTYDVELGKTTEPIFTYRNAEISTIEQAEATAKKLIEDISEQQRGGTVTVVGFPEVVPYDAIKMPNTEGQPMGGKAYGVYKVTHRLNATDGFITQIEVSAPVGVTKVVASDDVEETTIGKSEDDYTSGRKREYGPGISFSVGQVN